MTGWLAPVIAAVATALWSLAPVSAPADSGGVGAAIVSGHASFVGARYGARYLALPHVPHGTRVRITGPGGRVVRSSTDVGPDQSVFPDRVADLSYSDFELVCGPRAHERGLGTCRVTVEYLGSLPEPKLPATDTGP